MSQRNWNTANKGLSITTKFSMAGILFFFLIIIVAVTGYYSLMLVRGAEDSILINREIQQMTLEMDRGMEKARRLHGDFFLQYPVMGLTKAHETYAQPSIRQASQVIKLSKNLKKIIETPGIVHVFAKNRINLNLYQSSANRFIETSIRSYELVTQLAAVNTGIEAQLENQLNTLKTTLGSHHKLIHHYRELTYHTQEYRIKRQRHLMQSGFNVLHLFRRDLSKDTSIPTDSKKTLTALMNLFEDNALKILEIDIKIKSIFNDFSLQAATLAPVSGSLIELAKIEVEQAQKQIAHTHRTALIIIVSITLAGLLTAIIVGIILNNTITRKLILLTRTAELFRQGNLDVSVSFKSTDELGQLARTFNEMTARIRGLVNTLEAKVAERTSDLELTNKKLIREIDDRIKIEENLKETQAILQAAMDNSMAGIAIAEAPGGRLRYVNKAGLLIRGGTKEKLVDNIDLNDYVESWQIENHDGTPLKTEEVPLAYSIIHGKPCSKELIIRRSDNEPRFILANAAPIYDDTNEVQAAIVVFVDVTEKKQAEIEKETLEAQLRQAQKMEAIGTLAGGIAHDFNNILTAILGFADMAMDDIPNGNPARSQIDEVLKAGHRAKELVEQILTFSRKSQKGRSPVQFHLLVNEALKLLRATIPSTIEIKKNLNTDCDYILADPTQVHQVLMNLGTNAAQSMEEDGGTLEVSLDCCKFLDNELEEEPSLKPGDYLKLSVTDTGPGIPPEIIDRVFEPYFTTKETGKGSGMGLAVVHGIVKSHEGVIRLNTGINKGTTFEVYLPQIEVDSEKEETGYHESAPTGSEHILVVDDEESVVKMTCRRLEKLGYRTTTFTNSLDAIKSFQDQPDMFDLVITDQTMPHLTGEQLSMEMLSIRPDIPIILCTGYSSKIDKNKARKLGIKALVMKPFRKETIAVTIRSVLDAKTQGDP